MKVSDMKVGDVFILTEYGPHSLVAECPHLNKFRLTTPHKPGELWVNAEYVQGGETHWAGRVNAGDTCLIRFDSEAVRLKE